MKKFVLAAAAIAVAATTAIAATHDERVALMKQMGAANGALSNLAKAPSFDAAAVKAQLQILIDASAKIPAQYDAQNGDTAVLPVAFTDKEGFAAAAGKLNAAATAALSATSTAELQTALAQVGPTCGGCHRVYRAPRPAATPAPAPAPAQ